MYLDWDLHTSAIVCRCTCTCGDTESASNRVYGVMGVHAYLKVRLVVQQLRGLLPVTGTAVRCWQPAIVVVWQHSTLLHVYVHGELLNLSLLGGGDTAWSSYVLGRAEHLFRVRCRMGTALPSWHGLLRKPV